MSNDVRGVLLDLDGTLAVGNPNGGGYTLLPGVMKFVDHLRAHGLPVVVFTNGTAKYTTKVRRKSYGGWSEDQVFQNDDTVQRCRRIFCV